MSFCNNRLSHTCVCTPQASIATEGQTRGWQRRVKLWRTGKRRFGWVSTLVRTAAGGGLHRSS